jgi:uncharacterized protein (DUF736 family)
MAQEYDETNKGVAFTPFDTMRMILQGKLNIEGTERRVVLVADETKSGKKLVGVYQKIGVLFVNDKKGNENAPDYSGSMDEFVSSKELRIAGWKKQSDAGNNFLSMSISEKQQADSQQKQVAHVDFDDKVPF